MISELLSFILNTDRDVFIIAFIISSLVYCLAYLIIVRRVMNSINSKIKDFSSVDEVQNKLAIYIICALFWPAALVLGKNYLAKPETAKTGRVCIIIFLWITAFILVASLISVFYLYVYLPEIIEFLKGYNL